MKTTQKAIVKVDDILNNIGEDINTMLSITSDLSKKISSQNKELTRYALSGKEIRKILKISEPTLIKRRKLGLIPFFILGRSFYYLKPEGGFNV